MGQKMAFHQGRELARGGSRGAIGAPRWVGSDADQLVERMIVVTASGELSEAAETLGGELVDPSFAQEAGGVAIRMTGMNRGQQNDAVDLYVEARGMEADLVIFADGVVRKLAQLGGRASSMGITMQYMVTQPVPVVT